MTGYTTTSKALTCDRCGRRCGCVMDVKHGDSCRGIGAHGVSDICVKCFEELETAHAKLTKRDPRPFVPTLVWCSEYAPKVANG